jgi:hypothetical protein
MCTLMYNQYGKKPLLQLGRGQFCGHAPSPPATPPEVFSYGTEAVRPRRRRGAQEEGPDLAMHTHAHPVLRTHTTSPHIALVLATRPQLQCVPEDACQRMRLRLPTRRELATSAMHSISPCRRPMHPRAPMVPYVRRMCAVYLRVWMHPSWRVMSLDRAWGARFARPQSPAAHPRPLPPLQTPSRRPRTQRCRPH